MAWLYLLKLRVDLLLIWLGPNPVAWRLIRSILSRVVFLVDILRLVVIVLDAPMRFGLRVVISLVQGLRNS